MELIAANIPAGSMTLDTDEWQSNQGSYPAHAPGCYGVREWAQDDDGNGR
jgi:hypothetical protein